jgi:hypothetical protein
MGKMNRRAVKVRMRIAGGLSDAERRALKAFPTGSLVKVAAGSLEDGRARTRRWESNQLIRAEFLVSLLCGAVEAEPGQVAEVNITGACIIGVLGFPGVIFKHRLRLSNCYLPGGIDLTEATVRTLSLDGCHVAAINLLGATIEGSLSLGGAYVEGERRKALAADRLAVTGNIFCDNGFQSYGEVSLSGASVGGQLIFRSAHLNGNGAPALSADGLRVADAMFCDRGFQTCGELRLVGARIGGQLHFKGARLDGNGERALTADSLTIADSLFCQDGFQADGEIHLSDANIGGELNFSGARLDGKGQSALTADRARIKGNVLCEERFQASGETRFAGASIGSQLSFNGAFLNSNGGPSLVAEWLSVAGNMYCSGGFQACGEVSLSSASIGGQLILSGAHLNGQGNAALLAQGLIVARDMFIDEGFEAHGIVNLNTAKIGALIDDAASWPQALELDGMTYGDLTSMPARERLDWVKRAVDYAPQPYEQLAAHYRRLGHDEEARRVLLAKLRQRRRQRAWWARWWGWLQDGLVGYGYAPGRATLLLIGAFVAGWLVFSLRHPTAVGPGPHAEFNAALYTLDVLIPAPALGQASDFDPQGATLAVAAGLHILGWLLAITVIAAITRSFSRT